MGEKIVVGPVNKGLRNDVTPFNIDNDSFPVLTNAYQWRGRVKRKRGTSLLGRLTRYFDSTSISYNPGAFTTPPTPATASTTITLLSNGMGGFTGNLLTGNPLTTFPLQADGNIVPGSVSIIDITVGNTYTDPGLDGILVGNPVGSGTINYATGDFTLIILGPHQVTATFLYTPNLPVMGLEDLTLGVNQFPGTLAFDTTYSYNIKTTAPYQIYDVSFYKNPAVDASLPGYVPKTNETPTTWNGQDYQQFWTVNYQGALWATNGIPQPFSITNIGMQYKFITGVTIGSAGPPALANLTIVAHGLFVGDFLFINEVGGITGINLQTGYVTVVVDANTVTVEFPNATLGGAYTTGGIAQYLTNRSDITKDCLRWYDGDPTNGSATSPVLNGVNGWVNFAPPLNDINLFPDFSIADLPPAQYYLVGAKMIVPFKDRLLFIGPVVQTSSAGSQEYLQDTVIYSQNGTPYYTASFTGDPTLTTTFFNPILVPDDQTASPIAYYEDLTGFGGFQTAGVDQPINTASSNEDVLILGFDKLQTRFVYSGNDITPFNFFIINSELGSGSTFSAINMDEGVITRGTRGWIITSQVETKRVDLSIPDEVFRISLKNNGSERFTAQRDFINEWAYFTFPSNLIDYKFPNMTLQYNYRDNSWARFFECYTTYGQFKPSTGYTWATIGTKFPTWGDWDEPWNSGSSTLLQPKVIAGNQQGFILFREEGTGEGNSLYIQNIVGATVTSPNHCLNNGDYIIISGALGTVSTAVNGKIFSVANASTNSFDLNPPPTSGTYIGGGVIKRMYVPFFQTKQFPVAWGMSRKVRLGVQQYLFSATDLGQVTLLIFLSQNAASPYNDSTIDLNSGLIYSTLLYTCTESSNLGLTPPNTNLQMFSVINSAGTNASSPQSQIWHRMNTSLIGDTVQIGITLNDTQMRDTDFKSQFEEIELHGFIIDVTPSSVLV
jgi:hypothetical protein